MAVRPPRSLTPRNVLEGGSNALEYELMQEKASALAIAGRRAETAVEALRAHDSGSANQGDRTALVLAASRAVWAYFIQRELCGFRNHRDVIRILNIPAEVLNRLGQMTTASK